MSTCKNCQSKLTCSCQERVASDGKKVCSNCISKYELYLNQSKTVEIKLNDSITKN